MKKTVILRCILGVLILLNLWMIYGFSSQSADVSGQTSEKVIRPIASVVVKDFEEKPSEEQTTIVSKMQFPVRKLAHMTEFGTLGALVMLLLRTWKRKNLVCAGLALATVFVCASIDELHQYLAKAGRSGRFTDVLIDCTGALIACLLLCLILWLFRCLRKRKSEKRMKITHYRVACPKLAKPLRIALASDLHDNPFEPVIDALREEKPDLILIPGDLTDDSSIRKGAPETLKFLKACAGIAPTFYSPGNHEVKCYHGSNPFRHPKPIPIPAAFRVAVTKTGAVFLDNDMTTFRGMAVCGLSSGICGAKNEPDIETVEKYRALKNDVKILLCHHPEYFMPYLKGLGMDLVVCGHAHGGHWRFFGRGVYAPGQGLFPRYTSGVVGGTCVISRGLGDHTKIPRLFNPRELVMISFGGDENISKIRS